MENLKQQYHSQKTEDEPISEKELKDTIKRLKRRKSLGPDEIPNELFIEADSETRRTLLDIINKVHKSENIPISWLEGEIKRLYKGKGTKGKCSNERGITLASNVGKVYERILNERTKKEVQITEAQGGGIAGNATVDHLIVLNEAIRQIRQKGKTAYVLFLDVQKAYDKAWFDAILYVMHKNGISAKNLEMMRKMNSDLTARIRTKYGLTRKIKIKDSIRQGGVLSVIEYATLMDEITKELQEKRQGLTMKKWNHTPRPSVDGRRCPNTWGPQNATADDGYNKPCSHVIPCRIWSTKMQSGEVWTRLETKNRTKWTGTRGSKSIQISGCHDQ